MERKPYEDDPSLLAEELNTLHRQLCLEAANTIDELGGVSHELSDGRLLVDAKWEDAEGMRCILKMLKMPDPNTVLDGPQKQKQKIDYFLARETSMPGEVNRQYYFTSLATVGRIVDEQGKTVFNESSVDDLKYMKLIYRSIIERPTRVVTDESISGLALEFIISDEVVRANIGKIGLGGRHAKARMTVERVVNFILTKEPLIPEEVVKKRVLFEHAQLTRDPRSEPMQND